MIQFTRVLERAELVDPAGNRAEQVIEHRTDPLTGAVASVNEALGEKARAFLGTPDVELLRDLQERSKPGCPFCSAGDKGTRFVGDAFPEGQLRRSSSIAVPNLFSKCRLDSVVIIDHTRHVLFPSLIGEESVANALRLAVEIVRRGPTVEPGLVHHLVGMNFLHPGGSSVPHPHFQVHVRGLPYSGVARLVELGARFEASTGRRYWDELLDAERRLGERWIGRTGAVEWIAPFAPSHQKEVWGVLRNESSLARVGDDDVRAFAAGMHKVMAHYERVGNHPFTLAFLSSPAPSSSFSLLLKMCARPAFRSLYANFDTWFGPKLAGDEVHTEAPERLAAELRAAF